MEPFVRLRGTALPLLLDNVDTDTIIRVERLFNAVPRAELGRYCFETLRKRSDGSDDPASVLNQPRYRGASILLTGRNFGCGSAREGAVWALASMGIRCIIGTSLADLFVANCFQNGVLAFTLDEAAIARLAAVAGDGNAQLIVDLKASRVIPPTGASLPFTVPARRREALLEGLNEIDLTLKKKPQIQAFQASDRRLHPWIYSP